MCKSQWCPCGWPEDATYQGFMDVWTVGFPLDEERALDRQVAVPLAELDRQKAVEKARRRRQKLDDD